MKELEELAHEIISNRDFCLTEYNPNATDRTKFLYNFYKNLDRQLVFNEILKYYNYDDIHKLSFLLFSEKNIKIKISVQTLKSNFGLLDKFKENIDYEFLEKGITKNLEEHVDILLLLPNEIKKYIIEQAIKDKNINIHSVLKIISMHFDYDVFLDYILLRTDINIFDILTFFKESDHYKILKKFNNPKFILENANHNLVINEMTLKYFLEICPPDLKLYSDLVKIVGFENLFLNLKNKIHIEIILNLIETLDDLKIILTHYNKLADYENILKFIHDKYPHFFIAITKTELSSTFSF